MHQCSDHRVLVQSVEEDEGLKAVHEAFNSGINYFDTSPWYGELRAEIVSGDLHCELKATPS